MQRYLQPLALMQRYLQPLALMQRLSLSWQHSIERLPALTAQWLPVASAHTQRSTAAQQ
jgi:hypothetical protein